MQVFLVRLAEQAAVAFVLAFGASVAAGSGSITRDLLGGALGAALRAAYGVVVKNVGAADRPSVK